MSFEMLWNEIWGEMSLPNEAKILIPQSLSDKTKQLILESNMCASEIAQAIETSVSCINKGSVLSLYTLVNQKIKKGRKS